MPDDSPPTCSLCENPRCLVEITSGWPQAARDAYEAAGFDMAPTCGDGQRRDMRQIGWCYDRAFYHEDSTLVTTSQEVLVPKPA